MSKVMVVRPHFFRQTQIGYDIGWSGVIEGGPNQGQPYGPIYFGNVKNADSLRKSLPEYRQKFVFTLSEECERFLRGEAINGDPPDFRETTEEEKTK